jgi:bla regulator protein BlaR1
MILYLLKSILCLGIFLLVYFLFLEKEKMHRFNRWYLLGSIVFACLVPLVNFTVTQDLSPVLQRNYFAILNQPANVVPQQVFTPSSVSTVAPVDYIFPVALIVYALVFLVLLVRFVRNIYRLLSTASKNKTISYRGADLVLLKENTASYSFLHYIFISDQDYKDSSIEDEIITHELTHVKQKHSWDVIFIELLQIVFWFNPLFVFYKKAIQLNHEYLADEAVIRTHNNVQVYQALLLDKAGWRCRASFTSNFNYSVTKKRLVMMTRSSNRTISFLKKIAVLPLLAIVAFVFSTRTVLAQDKTAGSKKNTEQPANEKWTRAQLPWGVDKTPFTKEGVSPELLAKYKAFEKKFENVKPKTDFPEYSEEEKYQAENIFKQMSRQQQRECQVYFIPPIGPSKAEHPAAADLARWTRSKIYGVLIDGEKIPNEKLAEYTAADFSSFGVGLKLKEEFRKKFGYSYEVLLTTNEAFKKYNAARRADKHFEMVISFTKSPGKNKES